MAHTIKALLSHYDAAFRQKFGVKAPLVPSKDTALAKRLLALYSLEQLTGWVDRFFASTDPFILQSGYTFGVFHSQIGKLIAARRGPALSDAKLAQLDRQQQAIDDQIAAARRRA